MKMDTCTRLTALLLAVVMTFGMIGNGMLSAHAAAPDGATDIAPEKAGSVAANETCINITAAGGNNYPLFNSGRTESKGYSYGSNRGGSNNNINIHSYNNGGYDIFEQMPAVQRPATIEYVGCSFLLNVNVDELAKVLVYAYDTDETEGECDTLYLIDETTNAKYLLGNLSGMDENWNTTEFNISPDYLIYGHQYHFSIVIDSEEGDNSHYWLLYVRAVNLIINGNSEPPVAPTTGIKDADLSASISSSGSVSAALTASAYAEKAYTLEYKAVLSSSNAQYGGKEYSVTIPTSSERFTTTFQLESGAPRGTYEITVFIKDSSGNVVTTRTAVASYGYSAVSYNANGGSQNLPTDSTTYSSGDTVTVRFDYIPSMYGYTFLGWSTNRNATVPMYTASGIKTFTIGASDVTLYAVWEEEKAACEPGDWIIDREPTCTQMGSKHIECTDCGETLQTEAIAALGHNYVYTRTVEPTCTAEGYDLYTCDRNGCGSTKRQMIDKIPHDYGDDNVCDGCGHTIPVVHTHSYTSVVVAPTCTTMGYTEYTCSCGYSYRAQYIENLPHEWTETVTTQKTCTSDGLKTYSCANCTASFTEVIPAGHNWQETVTRPATCTTDGQLSRTCADCGAVERQVIPAGHTWNDGTQTKAPTCTEAGLLHHTCTACGCEETISVDPLGHAYVNGVCTRCGARFIDNVTSDTAHPEYGMYFEVDDIKSGYGPDLINEYGVLLDYNPDAQLKKVGVYLTQDGTMWRRCIAAVGDNISYATYVPYLSYDEDIKYTGLNSAWINTFRLSKNRDNIWCYSNYATIGVNLEDADGNLLLSLYDIGQAGAKTRIFDDLDEMIAWLKDGSSCITHTYDHQCDTDCNICGQTRTITHSYDNRCDTTCNVCGEGRTVPGHVYDYVCDEACNECGAVRTVTHTYDNDRDVACNVCGYDRTQASGQTGSCSWYVVGTRLYISGNGDMGTYSANGPWGKDITEVVIADGVTSIGKYAFGNCTKLVKVTLPASVTSVKSYAFTGCSSLTEVFYGGTEQRAEEIDIYSGNQMLTSALWHCKTQLAAPVLKGTNDSSGRAKLTWTAVPEADAYRIFYGDHYGYRLVELTTTTQLQYVDNFSYIGDIYVYRVVAIDLDDDTRDSDYSNEVDILTKCAAPKLTVKTGSAGKPVLTWNKVSSAKKYEIWRSVDGGAFKKLTTTTKLTYTDSKATTGSKCTYKIKTLGSSSGYDSIYSATGSCYITCAAPSLTVKADSKTGYPYLSWKKVTGAKSYAIYRSVNGGEYQQLTTTSSVSYKDQSAKVDNKYSYYVVTLGKEAALNSIPSSAKSITLAVKAPKLSGSANANGKPVISWTAVEKAVSYKIYRSTKSSKSYSLVATTKNLSYTDTTVAVGKTFYYKVVAVGSHTESAQSAYLKMVGKCATPATQVVLDEDSGKPVISWSKIDGAKKYTIYRATSANGKYKKAGTTTKLTYTDTKATVGTKYFYKIVANPSSSSANSNYSNIESCLSICAKAAVTAKVDAATGKPTLSWKKVTGAKTYQIYRSENGGEYVLVATQTAVTYKDNTAVAGKAYSYRVKVVSSKSGCDSLLSAEKTVIATCAQPKVKGKVGATGKPELTWGKAADATKYVIYRSTSKSKGFTVLEETEDLSFTDTTAVKGKTYYYKIVAVCGDTQSAQSAVVKVKSK